MFTATVSGSAPTGNVAFTAGGSTISGRAAMALSGSGNIKTAGCSTSSLAAGTHNIVASYGGDGTNTGSTSTTLAQVVNNRATSTTSLVSSLNPSDVGMSVAFTASVTGNAPTGAVAFTDGGSTISGCAAVALSGRAKGKTKARAARCRTSGLAAGTHRIVATYSGDASLVSPASTRFSSFSIPFSLATSGAHTVAFTGTDPSDKTTFIDAVTIH